MLGMSEELKVAASVLIRERELAHKRGYAEGLEAAANQCKDAADRWRDTTVYWTIADSLMIDLSNEAKRVREMGVPTEVAK